MVMSFVPGAAKNRAMEKQVRPADQSNIVWLSLALDRLKGERPLDKSYILLLGANDILSWRLRVAQSHLRFDMLPSYWSMSALLKLNGDALEHATVLHVPLFQPADARFATERNGLVESPLSLLENAHIWKNIAVIAMPLAQQAVLDQVDMFCKSRGYLDALEHVLRWLAFAWGVARTPNPIHDGVGLPSACMLETLFAGAGMDLTPGLETRASSPEAIWATARYWYQHFENNGLAAPTGRYYAPHTYEIKH